jgi:hypothetical protein
MIRSLPLPVLDGLGIETQGGSRDLLYLAKLVLPVLGGKKSIHAQIVVKGTRRPNPNIEETNLANTHIYFQNRDITDRVTRALRHAIELCGKQREPF